MTSCFRSPELCVKIGSSLNSQHTRAEAVDFECLGTDNAEVFDWIKANLKLGSNDIEFYTPGEPNSGWIHCSYVSENPRKQLLRAYREDGKTKYKPIIGNATDLGNPIAKNLRSRLYKLKVVLSKKLYNRKKVKQ